MIPSLSEKYLDNIPKGIIKRKNSKDLSLKIELCSFEIVDSSRIKKISLWHHCSKQLGKHGTDVLRLEGDGIHASPELDHLGTTRCWSDSNSEGIAYFLDPTNPAILDVTKIIIKIHQTYPNWLTRNSLCEIMPKLKAFIHIPSVRGLKKMQYEAQYLFRGSVIGSSFSDFLSLLSSNTLQFEKCSLAKLQCLVCHEIKTFKEQMSSPREGQTLELTTPHKFMREHEARLINHIKRVARKRIMWGCNGEFEKNELAYKRTIAFMLTPVFDMGVIQQIATFDL